MRLLYIITKLIVFPGAYLRGFWEQLTCRLLKLMVEPGGYIRLDEACGHVEHSLAEKQFAAYLMATGPGFMNFNMGMAFFLFGYINMFTLGVTRFDSIPLYICSLVALYIGVSLLCCLFPLTEDILRFWDIAYGGYAKKKRVAGRALDGVGKVLGFPFAAITRLGAFLEKNCVIFILWAAFLVWRFLSL